MSAQDQLNAFLDALGPGKWQERNGEYQCNCPAHDDKSPSLSVSISRESGKLLIHCHAGCKVDSILQAVGRPDLLRMNGAPDRPSKAKSIVATYDYTDENGKLLFQALRYQPKDFKQRQPITGGDWRYNLKGVRRVLYRLPEVLKGIAAGRPIYVTEGEKDANKIIELGAVATCNPMGAGKWTGKAGESYSKTLEGADVRILPDNDKPGRDHAEKVALSLSGRARSIKIINLPDISSKQDPYDWITKHGGTLEKLEALATAAPEWEKLDTSKPVDNGQGNVGLSDASGEFWYWEQSKKAGEPDKLKISRKNLIRFLEANGFCKTKAGEDCLFIRKQNNIVSEVRLFEIRDFTLEYVKALDIDERESVLTALYNQSNTLFAQYYLESLQTVSIPMVKREPKSALFYFKNCFVRVTPEGLTTHSYTELPGCIWEKQIVSRDFAPGDFIGCEYERFIENISGKEDPERYKAFISAIGYLLHGHKNKANARAVICVDEKIPRNDREANGRTGKGIFFNGIKQLRKTVIENGKAFRTENTFQYQEVSFDTEVLVFDDVKKRFPFEFIFSTITEDMQLNKKHKGQFSIPFEQSPKIIITTNHTIQGKGSSYAGRKFEIEFSEHYNERFTPKDDFGHLLFDEWDNDEWRRFDNYMLDCCRRYLETGLIDYEKSTLPNRQLMDSTHPDFVEYASFAIDPGVTEKKTLYENFLNDYPDFTKGRALKSNTFTRWVQEYCDYKDWQYDTRRSNGKQYHVITKQDTSA